MVDDEAVRERALAVTQEIIEGNGPQAYRVTKPFLKQWNSVAMVSRDVARELTANVWDSEEFRDRGDAFLSGEDLEARSFPGTLGNRGE